MNTLRIATWNVERPKPRSWKRLPALRAELDRVRADVWVLTETHSDLRPQGAYNTTCSGAPDREHWPGESWVTIWSRFPILRTEPTADPARSACAVLGAPNGRELIVYGTVLPWLGSGWRNVPAADGAAFSAALAAQRADWMRLRSERPDAHFVLAGDFNQDLLPTGHSYGSRKGRETLRQALRDACLVPISADPVDAVARQCGGQRAAIDHICVSDSLLHREPKVEVWPAGTAPDASLSDHFGIIAETAAA